MNCIKTVLTAILILISADRLFAAESPPPKEAYRVVEETAVSGQFSGCNAQKGIPINSKYGKLFICTTYGYSPFLYHPRVTVLKNQKGEYKVLINGSEYKGYFIDDFQPDPKF